MNAQTSPTLFGHPLQHAMDRMGSLAQAARLDKLCYEDGPMRGSRLVRGVTGGGLSFELHPDRALDIGAVEVAGKPFSWLSPTRIVHPGLYDGSAANFLRTFGGGFLLTCGLDHTGARSVGADGQVYPQHGRINAVPAELRRCEVTDTHLCIEGVVRQVATMKEHLELVRRIEAPLGQTSFTVTDTITNRAHAPQPHVVLYHCNFGWPLIGEDVRLTVDSSAAEPQTPDAAESPFAQFDAPQPNRAECVYLHALRPGQATAQLHNPASNMTLRLTVDGAQLPGLVQWKMLAQGIYALGLEPTNARKLGDQGTLRQAGCLPVLAPGEQVTYRLAFALAA